MKLYIRKFLLALWLFVGLTSVPALAKDDDEDFYAWDKHDWWDYGYESAASYYCDLLGPYGWEGRDNPFTGAIEGNGGYGDDCCGYSTYDSSTGLHTWHDGSDKNDEVLTKIRDIDGNGIPDREEGYDPYEFDYDEPNNGNESSGTALEAIGDYPIRETPLNLLTDAEKNEYIMKIVEDLTEKLQEKLGNDFVPLPEVHYVNRANNYAETRNRIIYVKEPFFKCSDALQIAIILHEYTHYYNEIKGISSIFFYPDGTVPRGNVDFIHTPPEYSEEIQNYLKGDYNKSEILKEYNEDIQIGSTQKSFEKYYQDALNFYFNFSEKDYFTYQSSNLCKDEIAARFAMLQGFHDGWYQLSENEELTIKYEIENFQYLMEFALQYEQQNNIQPSGKGFVKP